MSKNSKDTKYTKINIDEIPEYMKNPQTDNFKTNNKSKGEKVNSEYSGKTHFENVDVNDK